MSRNPFKVGDYVVADDPFNGHAEGVVMVIHGRSMGLRVTNGPTDHYLYYDCRTVRLPD
ncbi:hypothetical protein ACQCSX_21450 (plasmid) [Pseudarthrobacter sp. P1]|uniref:hypothetical protein n=1 Tax=Pseudarthrobacter sp. P1 TaxID=3418418 RepID=UPI003CE98806